MLRVVSICRTLPTPDRPGAGIFVFNRLRAMSRMSNLTILQPIPYFPLLRPIPNWGRGPSHREQEVNILHEPMFYVPGIMKALDGRWLARSVVRRVSQWQHRAPIDLLDAHFGYPDGVGCVIAARRLGIPVFVTIRGLEAERVKQPALRAQIVKSMNAANGCISVSYALRDTMIANGVDANLVSVIPNAIDRQLFRPGGRAAMRARLGVDNNEALIVSVGHLISGKRHGVLINALARMASSERRVSLAIIGGVDYEQDHARILIELVRALNLTNRVRFVGGVHPEVVAQWLQAADVFALATAREGCCNAVLESLASGLPVVTTPVGDNPRYVNAGVNGFLVPVDDADAMAAGLTAALERSWDRERISNGLKVGSWGDVAREVLDYFNERLAAAKTRLAPV